MDRFLQKKLKLIQKFRNFLTQRKIQNESNSKF